MAFRTLGSPALPARKDSKSAKQSKPDILAQPIGVMRNYEVVYQRVAIRDGPSISATAVGVAKKGEIWKGTPHLVDGNPWVRVDDQLIVEREILKGKNMESAWMLMNGQAVGLGVLLSPCEEPAPHALVTQIGKQQTASALPAANINISGRWGFTQADSEFKLIFEFEHRLSTNRLTGRKVFPGNLRELNGTIKDNMIEFKFHGHSCQGKVVNKGCITLQAQKDDGSSAGSWRGQREDESQAPKETSAYKGPPPKPTGARAEFVVAFTKVIERTTPSVEGKIRSVHDKGHKVTGTPCDVDGMSWLQLDTGWMLMDGASMGLGQLLIPSWAALPLQENSQKASPLAKTSAEGMNQDDSHKPSLWANSTGPPQDSEALMPVEADPLWMPWVPSPRRGLGLRRTVGSAEALEWMAKKTALKQDLFLLGPPGSACRALAFQFCAMTNQEAMYLHIARDTSESDLKQRREISCGTLSYVHAAPVECAVQGRVLIIEGVEKAERNVLPLLNNLLENREMALESGDFLTPRHIEGTGTLPVRSGFLVIAIGLPVPRYAGTPLDPPLRSRFAAFNVPSPTSDEECDALRDIAPDRPREEMQRLVDTAIQLRKQGLPRLPEDSLQATARMLQLFRCTITVGTAIRMAYPEGILALTESSAKEVAKVLSSLPGKGHSPPRVLDVAASTSEKKMSLCRVKLGMLGDPLLFDTASAPCGQLDLDATAISTAPGPQGEALVRMLQCHCALQDFIVVAERGAGKTHLIRAFARMLGYRLRTIFCFKEMTARELLTRRSTDKDGNTEWVWGPLLQAAVNGEIAVLDGIHRLPAGLLSAAAGRLISDRAMDLPDGRLVPPEHYYTLLKSGHTEVSLKAANIHPVHPAFRIICAAEMPERLGPMNWLHDEILSLFLCVGLPALSDEEHHEMLKSSLPQEALQGLLHLGAAFRKAGQKDPALYRPLQLSTRRLLQMARYAAIGFGMEADALTRVLQPPFALLSDAAQKAVLAMVEEAVTKGLPKVDLKTKKIADATSGEQKNRLSEDKRLELEKEALKLATGKGSADRIAAERQGASHEDESACRAVRDERLREAESAVRAVKGNTAKRRPEAAAVRHGVLHIGNASAKVLTPQRQELVPQAPFVEIPQHQEVLRQMLFDWTIGHHMLLIGPQGVGKNMIADRLLQLLRAEREYTQLHRDSTVNSLVSAPSLIGGKVVWGDSPLVRALLYGRVIVVDEADKAPIEVVCVLKALVEDGEYALPDGRLVSKHGRADDPGVIVPGDGFRVIVLANKPGYPFLGNNFYRVCGDVFAALVVETPDMRSEAMLLSSYGPTVEEQKLARLLTLFADLRLRVAEGSLIYPYSARELVKIVRHLEKFSSDGLDKVCKDIFAFDLQDGSGLLDLLLKITLAYGIDLKSSPNSKDAPKVQILEQGIRAALRSQVTLPTASNLENPEEEGIAHFRCSPAHLCSCGEQSERWGLVVGKAAAFSGGFGLQTGTSSKKLISSDELCKEEAAAVAEILAATNHYEALGADQHRSIRELRACYLFKSVSVHPDKNGHDDAGMAFRKLAEAWEALKNEDAKQRYDSKLSEVDTSRKVFEHSSDGVQEPKLSLTSQNALHVFKAATESSGMDASMNFSRLSTIMLWAQRLVHAHCDEDEEQEEKKQGMCEWMFNQYDSDQDGFLNLEEMQKLTADTGDELDGEIWPALTEQVSCEAEKGITQDGLFQIYSMVGAGDIAEEYWRLRDLADQQKPDAEAYAVENVISASDLYAAIMAPHDASLPLLRKCYLWMALRVHPDKNTHKHATTAFQRLAEVWSILDSDGVSVPHRCQGAQNSGLPSTSTWTAGPLLSLQEAYEAFGQASVVCASASNFIASFAETVQQAQSLVQARAKDSIRLAIDEEQWKYARWETKCGEREGVQIGALLGLLGATQSKSRLKEILQDTLNTKSLTQSGPRCAPLWLPWVPVPRRGLGIRRCASNMEALEWMAKKTALKQDFFLLGPPGSACRLLALQFCAMTNQEVMYLHIARDTNESDLKQRREISAGTLNYMNAAPVEAAVNGRVLIIEGVEKAERNVLPLLNNLLENREMALESGAFLTPKHIPGTGTLPVKSGFLVIAIGLPVPRYTGTPLDPPLRSRFAAFSILMPSAEEELECLREVAPARAESELRMLVEVASKLRKDGLPRLPEESLQAVARVLQLFKNTISVGDALRMAYPEAILPLAEQAAKDVGAALRGLAGNTKVPKVHEATATEAERVMSLCRIKLVLQSSIGDTANAPCGRLSLDPSAFQNLPGPQSEALVRILQAHSALQDIMLVADRGTGKTHVIRVFAQLLGYRVRTVFCFKEMTARELLTRRSTDQDGNTKWQWGPILQAAVAGEIAVLDGIHRLPRGLLAASIGRLVVDRSLDLPDGRLVSPEHYHTLIRSGRSEKDLQAANIHPVHPAFRVICTAEPPERMGPMDWLTDELLSLFLFVCIGPLSDHDHRGLMSRALPDATLSGLLHLAAALRSAARKEPALYRPLQLSTRRLLQISHYAGAGARSQNEALVRVLRPPFALLPDTAQQNVLAMVKEAVARGLPSVDLKSTSATGKTCAEVNQKIGIPEEIRPEMEGHAIKVAMGFATKDRIYDERRKVEKEAAASMKGVRIERFQEAQKAVMALRARGSEKRQEAAVIQNGMLKIGDVQSPLLQPERPELVPQAPFVEIPQHQEVLRQLLLDWKIGHHMLLIGPQGVGKNKIADRLLELLRAEREYIQLHRDSTVASIVSAPSLVGGAVVWGDSPLVRALKYGRVLVVDEADKAPLEVVCVLKALVEDGEYALPDGRLISRRGPHGDASVIVPKDEFRVIVLANRPGFPFLGNNFFSECGDVFAALVVESPDLVSEAMLLRSYGPSISDVVLARLLALFTELRLRVEEGALLYPYSSRELVKIVRHMDIFPGDGLDTACSDVFAFDLQEGSGIMDLLLKTTSTHKIDPKKDLAKVKYTPLKVVSLEKSMKSVLLHRRPWLTQRRLAKRLGKKGKLRKAKVQGGIMDAFLQGGEVQHESAQNEAEDWTHQEWHEEEWEEDDTEEEDWNENEEEETEIGALGMQASEWGFKVGHVAPFTGGFGLLGQEAKIGAEPSQRQREEATAVAAVLTAPDHYAAIGAVRDALTEEINESYLKTAVRVHPENNYHPEAASAFQRAADAFLALGDEESRRQYDEELKMRESRTSRNGHHAGSSENGKTDSGKSSGPANQTTPEDAFAAFQYVTETISDSSAGGRGSGNIGESVRRAQRLVKAKQESRSMLQLTDDQQAMCDWIFDRYDVDTDGFLNFDEAQHLSADMGNSLSEEMWKGLNMLLDCDPAKGLTREGISSFYMQSKGGDLEKDYKMLHDLAEKEKDPDGAAVAAVLAAVDHYAVLSAPRGAPTADIRKCYLKTSLRVHPDKNKHPDAKAAFQRVAEAWAVLGNEESRRRYDATLPGILKIGIPVTKSKFKGPFVTTADAYSAFAKATAACSKAARSDPNFEDMVHQAEKLVKEHRPEKEEQLALVDAQLAVLKKENEQKSDDKNALLDLIAGGHASENRREVESKVHAMEQHETSASSPNGPDEDVAPMGRPGQGPSERDLLKGQLSPGKAAPPTKNPIVLGPMMGMCAVASAVPDNAIITGGGGDDLPIAGGILDPEGFFKPGGGGNAKGFTKNMQASAGSPGQKSAQTGGGGDREGAEAGGRSGAKGGGSPGQDEEGSGSQSGKGGKPGGKAGSAGKGKDGGNAESDGSGKGADGSTGGKGADGDDGGDGGDEGESGKGNQGGKGNGGGEGGGEGDSDADGSGKGNRSRKGNGKGKGEGNGGDDGDEGGEGGEGAGKGAGKVDGDGGQDGKGGKGDNAGGKDGKEGKGSKGSKGGKGKGGGGGGGNRVGAMRGAPVASRNTGDGKVWRPGDMDEEMGKGHQDDLPYDLFEEEPEPTSASGPLHYGNPATYEMLKKAVLPQVTQMRELLKNHEAKEKEREWKRGQGDGELDDLRLVEAACGDQNVFRRRIDSENPALLASKPKRLIIACDLSPSMSVYDVLDDRLRRLQEALVFIFESFTGFMQKYDYMITGYSAAGFDYVFVPWSRPPRTPVQRLSVLQRMVEHAKSAPTGDGTLSATEWAIKEVRKREGDEYFVFVVSDAELTRHDITPSEWSKLLMADPEVNAYAIIISMSSSETKMFLDGIDPGHGFACQEKDELSGIFKKVFSETLTKEKH